jgi:hypothetical protein
MNTQFKVEKGTIDGSTPQINPNALYLVDFSKIESVNDLVLILASMQISFSPLHPNFDQVKRFLAIENPITSAPQNVQPEAKEVVLPKLKIVK